jgi:hypothetical protein
MYYINICVCVYTYTHIYMSHVYIYYTHTHTHIYNYIVPWLRCPLLNLYWNLIVIAIVLRDGTFKSWLGDRDSAFTNGLMPLSWSRQISQEWVFNEHPLCVMSSVRLQYSKKAVTRCQHLDIDTGLSSSRTVRDQCLFFLFFFNFEISLCSLGWLQPFDCWDYRYVSPHLTDKCLFLPSLLPSFLFIRQKKSLQQKQMHSSHLTNSFKNHKKTHFTQ